MTTGISRECQWILVELVHKISWVRLWQQQSQCWREHPPTQPPSEDGPEGYHNAAQPLKAEQEAKPASATYAIQFSQDHPDAHAVATGQWPAMPDKGEDLAG